MIRCILCRRNSRALYITPYVAHTLDHLSVHCARLSRAFQFNHVARPSSASPLAPIQSLLTVVGVLSSGHRCYPLVAATAAFAVRIGKRYSGISHIVPAVLQRKKIIFRTRCLGGTRETIASGLLHVVKDISGVMSRSVHLVEDIGTLRNTWFFKYLQLQFSIGGPLRSKQGLFSH